MSYFGLRSRANLLKIIDYIGFHRSGAGEGNRTLVSGLGSPHSAIEPHPLTLRFGGQARQELHLISTRLARRGPQGETGTTSPHKFLIAFTKLRGG